jgi:3-hydroxybutyryl-CoA dehydrogenase
MSVGGVTRVGVVGCGLMGSGIAEVCARAGLPVVAYDVDAAATDRGRQRIEGSLNRAVSRGKLSSDVANGLLDSIRLSNDLSDLHDCDLVVEAIVEEEQAKIELFAKLDGIIANENAILASNTSSIPIMKIAMATRRPQQVLGVHFFNPVPVLALVELVPSMLTSVDVEARARTIATDVLGKSVIRSQDRAGFVVNSLLVPYILSAICMIESGFASPTAQDSGTAPYGQDAGRRWRRDTPGPQVGEGDDEWCHVVASGAMRQVRKWNARSEMRADGPIPKCGDREEQCRFRALSLGEVVDLGT